MKLIEMIKALEPFGIKTRPHLTSYCRDGVIPAMRKGNIWYPDDGYVNRALVWRKGQVTLEEMLEDNSEYSSLSDDDNKKKCLRSIKLYAAEHYQTDNEYSILFTGHFVKKDEIEKAKEIVAKESAYYANRNSLIPIKDAAKAMGVSVYQAKKMSLSSTRMQGDLYCDTEMIDQMNNTRSQYIGIYTLITEILPGVKTVFDPASETDRLMLRKYVRESDLADIALPAEIMSFPDDRRNAFYFPIAYKEAVSSALVPFLIRYGLVPERLAILSADPFWDSHPVTKGLLDRFTPRKQENGIAALMETLIYGLRSEITECTDDDIDKLLAYAEGAGYGVYKQYTVLFANFCKKKADKCTYNVMLKYDPPKSGKNVIDTRPYPFAQYFAFSHLLFSQPMIEKNDLVNKAFADIKYGLLWLYCIWQYCTAWRVGDFFRIPILRMPYTRDSLRQSISEGSFEQEAVTLSILLENEINSKQRRPNKTAEEQEASGEIFPLVVVFPENLRSVIGTVYAICIVMTDFKPFPVARFSIKDYEFMFGSVYTKILGHTMFQNRRANKAFMGSVVELAEKNPAIKAPVKGYALASFARAHVVTEGTLSDMTSRYLQYKMEGLSADEILMQLWDTGCCSFVPYMLLEAVYGDKFSTLPVSDQTEVILASGLTALTAEAGARLMRKAYLHDRDVVQTVLSSGGTGAATRVLQGLIDREAPSKQIGIMCVRSSLRLPCANQRSQKCVACPYKIPQVSSIYLIMSDIEELMDKMHDARTEGSRRKYFFALRDHYFPAAYQMLVFCKEQYRMNVSGIAGQLADLYEKGGLLNDPDQGKIG